MRARIVRTAILVVVLLPSAHAGQGPDAAADRGLDDEAAALDAMLRSARQEAAHLVARSKTRSRRSGSDFILDTTTLSGLRVSIQYRPAAHDEFGMGPALDPLDDPGFAFQLQCIEFAACDGIDAEAARTRFAGLLVRRLDQVRDEYRLDADEIARLKLAGALDIKHFQDRLDEGRPRLRAAGADLRRGLAVLHEMERLRDEFRRGLHGEGSMFAKTLAKILADRVAATAPGRR